jgi:hypothetical protein
MAREPGKTEWQDSFDSRLASPLNSEVLAMGLGFVLEFALDMAVGASATVYDHLAQGEYQILVKGLGFSRRYWVALNPRLF